jgi:hypothetical protein
MKRLIYVFLLFCVVTQAMGTDTIVTKRGRKFQGKVIRIIEKGFVVRTTDGSVIVLPKDNISKIYRDNKVLDFEEGMSYYLEVRRPFLPFIVLAITSGAYCVDRYSQYRKDRDEADEAVGDEDKELQYLNSSKKALAASIISGLFCVGSFYIAIRPMEVRIPIGKIRMSATSSGVTLALHF